MAEVKNAFIKSKMNKDLDSRLIPSGEYRDGLNIQVSKSEGADVGALENSSGNAAVIASGGIPVDFSVLSNLSTGSLKSIGMHSDVASGNIYIFLTNNTEEEYKKDKIGVIYSFNPIATEGEGSITKIVEGAFLNFSQKNPIYGINVLENVLFWTDNRNQPRNLDLNSVNPGSLVNSVYINEDLISVAKYNPYQPIELYSVTPSGVGATSMKDVTSLKQPGGGVNPEYIPNWPGDPDYLEDKFVAFSYRFKFSGGEYSILAPFTQEAFIPKQDGYFLVGDEAEAYRSTIVQFMENKVNSVELNIILPCLTTDLTRLFQIEELDIIYKESDSLTVKVLDTVTVSDIETSSVTNTYIYDYQSRKPYKTLPESEIIRVYDKVPVKAFGQEIISNRIVYSNFQDKHTPPETINYNVAVTEKDNFFINNTNPTVSTTSRVEYPMHTVKQNRSYQVGFVLSDRYGRQSTVILSPVSSETQIGFSGSTVYHPYMVDPSLQTPAASNYIDSWAGDSIKILVNDPISDNNDDPLWPGLYNGDINSDDYNPLGWYSYKVVVKQTEQEYYNVYLPGILNGYPGFLNSNPGPPDNQDTIAFVTLFNDNINKVPRNLTEVGPEQKQYGSSVKLFGRVTPNRNSAPTFTEPYYPQTNEQTVITIAEQDFMFNNATPATPLEFGTVYQTGSNPYLARLSQGNVSNLAASSLPLPIGSLQLSSGSLTDAYNVILGVYETSPVESLLDIFWETSTAGLISDLNEAAESGPSIDDMQNWDEWGQTEATEADALVFPDNLQFAPTFTNDEFEEEPIPYSKIEINKVLRGTILSTEDIKESWILKTVQPGTTGATQPFTQYNLIVQNPKYFEPAAGNTNVNTFFFTFSVQEYEADLVTKIGDPIIVSKQQNLIQVKPSISGSITALPSDPIPPIVVSISRNNDTIIGTLFGDNSATVSDGTQPTNQRDLSWSIPEINNPNPFKITIHGFLNDTTGKFEGHLKAPELGFSGNTSIKVLLTDSGDTAERVISFIFGEERLNEGFGKTNGKVEIITGLESAGVYWLNNYNQDLEDNVPAIVGTQRVAFSELEFPNRTGELISVAPGNQELIHSPDQVVDSRGDSYRWRNSNQSPKLAKFGGVTPTGLSKGTAFIQLDFQFESFKFFTPPANDLQEPADLNYFFGVAWPAYLQYKPTNGEDWIPAFDVEGKEIKFGSTATSFRNQKAWSKTGVMSSDTLAEDSPNVTEQSNSAQSAVQIANSTIDSTIAICSKLFVIGKDQGYEETQDGFGEYRLLIRYPANGRSEGRTGVLPITTTASGRVAPQFLNDGSAQTENKVIVNIQFGDFYESLPVDVGLGGAVPYYGYLVSEVGQPNRQAASGLEPEIQVYAREWAFGYVTQFYTDTTLRIPWEPYQYRSNENFYSYQGSQQRSETATVTGMDSSYPYATNSRSTPPGTGTLNATQIVDLTQNVRRWTAEFSSTGKKIIKTASPNLRDIP